MQNTEFYTIALCFEVVLMLLFSVNVDTVIQTSISFIAVTYASICNHELRRSILIGEAVVSNSVLIASYRNWRRDPSRPAPRDLIIGKELRN